MNPSKTFATGPWSTSAFPSESTPCEPGRREQEATRHALGEHLGACQRLRGPLFALRCSADALRGFVGARLVTSLLALLATAGLLTLFLL